MDPRTDKAAPDAARRPRLARDDLFADLEEQVDYGSDTSMASPRAPNPFPERGAAQEFTALRASSGLESFVITNALDEGQERPSYWDRVTGTHRMLLLVGRSNIDHRHHRAVAVYSSFYYE
jgi:hypothetical protein